MQSRERSSIVKRMFQAGGLTAVGYLAGSAPAQAQNIVTVNPSFESNTVFVNATGNVDGVPGWHAVMTDTTPGNYNSFVGAANDQPNTLGRNGTNFGYYHGALFQTAASARGAVTPGQAYQISFLLKNDAGSGDTTPTTVTLAFYDNNASYTNALTGSVATPYALVSTNLPSNPNGVFTPETFTAVAPAGASFAGVELRTTGTYIVDNFSITPVAAPEPGAVGLALVGVAGAAGMRRRRRAR
jgi:MYXO-CTERM domain-containing protein